MSQALFEKIESEQLRETPLDFNVGDIVKVHTLVREGAKERTQIFQGIVIGRRGGGVHRAGPHRRGNGRACCLAVAGQIDPLHPQRVR